MLWQPHMRHQEAQLNARSICYSLQLVTNTLSLFIGDSIKKPSPRLFFAMIVMVWAAMLIIIRHYPVKLLHPPPDGDAREVGHALYLGVGQADAHEVAHLQSCFQSASLMSFLPAEDCLMA